MEEAGRIEDLWGQIRQGKEQERGQERGQGQEQEVRAALSALRAEIKDRENYDRVLELAGDGAELAGLLSSEDAKTRKNAAALIGDLGLSGAAEALFAAYQAEEKLFIRGTLAEALGKTDADSYLPQLREQYEKLRAQEPREEERKHVREELKALERILRQSAGRKGHTFTGWRRRAAILLTTNPKYREVTAEKIHAIRKAPTPLGVKAMVDDLEPVLRIRTFRELLFPIALKAGLSPEDDPALLGRALMDSSLLPLLERSHREGAPFYFRLEIRNGMPLEERGRYARKLAAVLEDASGRKLLNSTSEYEFEIRILPDGAGRIHAFLKMNTIPMERFAYRKEAIAASIHPSTAALLMELASPYFRERAQVLDPCCGVGTMLVERSKILPAAEVYGVDIFGEAIDKARINCGAAGLRAHLVRRDYLDFQHKYRFDEIIANMPIRGKRSREEQDQFYQGFFRKSEELLAPEGIMALYSNEEGFIKKQLRLHPDLRLCEEFVIRERDRFALFVIGRRAGRGASL